MIETNDKATQSLVWMVFFALCFYFVLGKVLDAFSHTDIKHHVTQQCGQPQESK